MILWAIFTIGFISGGLVALYVLSPSRMEEERQASVYPKYTANLYQDDPDKLFDQLTQINHPTQVKNDENHGLLSEPVMTS